jgi:hypothetical protein
MTKKQEQKGHGNQKNSGGRAGSVTENVEKAEAGRSHKRNEGKSRDKHRNEERERGTFHIRVNEGRSNDILAAIGGETGSYAYPGGNRPSIHFNVQKEIFTDGSSSVIRLESIQEEHELEGKVFDSKVYVPCGYVQKFGLHFQSRREDRLAAATQELIVHYLARMSVHLPEIDERKVVDVWATASESCKSMLSERDGNYLVHSEAGDVIFRVYHLGKKACIKVLASKNPSLDVTNIFVPVHCLFGPSLQQVTDETTYLAQLATFMFIRTELASLIEEMTKKPTPAAEVQDEKTSLTDADRQAIGAAENRRERKAKERLAKQREEALRQVAVMTMRQSCLPAVQIATGKLGYTNLDSSSGELIVGFHIAGGDRIARIEHVGNCHMLTLAGVEKGDNIFASAILTGKVDRAHCTTEADFRKRSIIANHIREEMQKRGIHFHAKQSA